MSNKTIKTNVGEYVYNEKELYHGRKIIGKKQSKKNLFALKKVLEVNGLNFGLLYGTLLGAVRESDFITHDEDVDVFMLDEDKTKFLDLLFEIRNSGLDVIRYNGSLLSLMGGDDYIDVYFFKKKYFIYRECGILIHRSYYFEFTDKIKFLGSQFFVPRYHMKFIEDMYGKDWDVPRENAHAEPFTWKYAIKKFLKSKFRFNRAD
jgi:lipopolysaccharide cholinephosphotransferase